MRVYNLWYFFVEALRSIVRHFFHSFAAVTIMCACLLITCTFGIVTYNVTVAVDGLSEKSEIAIYIDDSVSREDAVKMKRKILEIPNVNTAEFITREELFEEYLGKLGDEAYILEDLREDNPLRDSYRVTMKNIELHEDTLAKLEEIEGVASTTSHKDLSDRLLQIRRILNAVSVILIVLLGSVSVFIIYNTVRMSMFSRKDEIAIMKMVGATDGFIKAPFVISGAMLGLASGGLAFLGEYLVYGYMGKQLLRSSNIFELVPFTSFSGNLLFIMLASGMLLGIFGSAVSIRKFLKV